MIRRLLCRVLGHTWLAPVYLIYDRSWLYRCDRCGGRRKLTTLPFQLPTLRA